MREIRSDGSKTREQWSVETLATEVNVLGDFNPTLPEVWTNSGLFLLNGPATRISFGSMPWCSIDSLDTFMPWIDAEFGIAKPCISTSW